MEKKERDKIYNILVNPNTELTWTEKELVQSQKLLQECVLAFKYHDNLGNTKEMEACNLDIIKLQKGISYLEDRLKSLYGVTSK